MNLIHRNTNSNMQSFFSNISSNSLFTNALKLSSSNVILYLLPLIVTPILSRIYPPDTFGGWGIFSSTTVILTVLLLGGYEYAIVKAKQQEIKSTIHLCILCGVFSILLIFSVFSIGEWSGVSFFELFPAKNLLYIYLFISIPLIITQNFANRIEYYSQLAISYLILGLSQAILRILFGFFHINQNGLILGTTIAQGIACLYLILCLKKNFRLFFSKVILNKIKQTAVKYKNFPLFDAPASLLSFSAFNLPIIILSLYYSKADIGCFSIIIQLLLMPMSFIGAAIGKVYYQQIAKSNNDIHLIHEKSLSIYNVLSYIALMPSVFILLGGNTLIVYFLGNQWHLAGDVALCLSIWSDNIRAGGDNGFCGNALEQARLRFGVRHALRLERE